MPPTGLGPRSLSPSVQGSRGPNIKRRISLQCRGRASLGRASLGRASLGRASLALTTRAAPGWPPPFSLLCSRKRVFCSPSRVSRTPTACRAPCPRPSETWQQPARHCRSGYAAAHAFGPYLLFLLPYRWAHINVRGLRRLLRRVFDNPDEARAVARRGREHIVRHYDQDVRTAHGA